MRIITKTKIESNDKIESNITRVARYILVQGETTKNEIAKSLDLSMPTILKCIKELINRGIVHEVGEFESTGGRKPKAISIIDNIYYSVGIEITTNRIAFVIINMKEDIIASKRIRLPFNYSERYFSSLVAELSKFIIESKISEKRILGVGVSIPGIVISDENKVTISHVLQLRDVDLNQLAKLIPFPVRFENDANSAALAEIIDYNNNTVYLSLSDTVGGSIYLNREIYYGDFNRSGEFGHMIIKQKGKKCYCGKSGCVDSYCSAKVLSSYTNDNLDKFFKKLSYGDEVARSLWDEYIEDLSLTVSNLHLAFNCEVILGGYVGSYIEPYMDELWECMQKYLLFDEERENVIRPCQFKYEAAAVGIAIYFIEQFISSID